MTKRFDSFSTEELITLYKALGNDKNAPHRKKLREQIRTLLEHRKVTMDKIFGPGAEPPTRSAGYRAYWAGASDIEAAACDNEEN